mgnify:FL=1
MEKIAEEIVQNFEEKMEPVMDSLQKANDSLQQLDDLLDEEKGFGFEHGLWQRSGWQEMEVLRKKLEDLKELRELVRSLGRSGGKGPKRKAPAQVSVRYSPAILQRLFDRSPGPDARLELFVLHCNQKRPVVSADQGI